MLFHITLTVPSSETFDSVTNIASTFILFHISLTVPSSETFDSVTNIATSFMFKLNNSRDIELSNCMSKNWEKNLFHFS